MNDVFQFYSKSRDVPPGRGAGERASRAYALPTNFRKMLSNFYLIPIEYKGEHYASVEHAFHATKLERFGHPDAADFAIGAVNYVGNEGGAVKRAGGKHGRFRMNAEQIASWNLASRGVLEELWEEKFGRNEPLRVMLKAMGGAELWHDMGRGKKERWVELENLRTRI